MRVSLLPPVLSPGRVHDLLVAGELSVAVEVSAHPAEGDVAFRLVGRLDGRGVVARPAAGLARLVAEVVRAERVEATRIPDGEAFAVPLSQTAVAWLTDRRLLWTLLAGAWGHPAGSEPAPPRRVDSTELLVDSGRDGVWTIHFGEPGSNGALSCLVVETEPTGDTIGRAVAAGIQRLRETLRRAGWPQVSAQVRRRDASDVSGGAALMRIDGPAARVYWPVRSFRGLLQVLAGGTGEGSSDGSAGTGAGTWNHLQATALLRVLDAEITHGGLLRLMRLAPRTAVERRARHAIRTIAELIREDGVAKRSLVDLAYRSGQLYRDLSLVALWCGPAEQASLRMGFGTRRWEQIVAHAERRHPGAGARPPWDQVAGAADRVVAELARRTEQPGQRPPVATAEIVRRYYLEPRGDRLYRVWRAQIADGALAALLEDVFLTQLKRDLPRLPRTALVHAAVGEASTMQQRIAAVFSRRGRQMFLEDVRVVEAAIDADRFREWDRLLAARRLVWSRYNRRSRARSRMSPA